MTCFRFTLQKAKSLDHGVREKPVEGQNLPPSPPNKLYSAHLSTATVQLLTKLCERYCLPALRLLAPFFDRVKRIGIGEDLSGFFQCLVLIYWDEYDCGTTPSGDDDMFPQVRHTIDDASEIAPKFSDRNRLTHDLSVPY